MWVRTILILSMYPLPVFSKDPQSRANKATMRAVHITITSINLSVPRPLLEHFLQAIYSPSYCPALAVHSLLPYSPCRAWRLWLYVVQLLHKLLLHNLFSPILAQKVTIEVCNSNSLCSVFLASGWIHYS